ncbi:MAG: lactonase family protein [Niabella sp.]|nr:MAG: lactonase family protein [Niabella sp.]
MKTNFFLAAFTLFSFYMANAQRLLVGTYTDDGKSKGIYIYNFDKKTGIAKEQSSNSSGNPSFLIPNKNNTIVYSVNEYDKGEISAFEYDKTSGSLKFINKGYSNGSAPCYLALDKTGKWLFTGNYGGGNLSVHSIEADGSIGQQVQLIQHNGKSINADRQSSPHVHCTYVSPDNKYVFVPDLGIDKVMIYPFNAPTGKLDTGNKSFITVKPGGGPRHIIFNKEGSTGYLAEEMSGNVNTIKKIGNEFSIIQTLNNLPKGQAGAGADIHLSPDEKFLYVSQRSNSTIQVFKVNKKNGSLQFVGETPNEGNFPRNFTIHPSGKYLLAANQRSNDITIFKRNKRSGLLTYTGSKIKVGTPVCLDWIIE